MHSTNKDVMINNDMDNGLDFWPLIIDNSAMISWKSGNEILEEIKLEKNLNHKKMLIERFKNINENSNPVLIIAK